MPVDGTSLSRYEGRYRGSLISLPKGDRSRRETPMVLCGDGILY
jgi:hypothetical protein